MFTEPSIFLLKREVWSPFKSMVIRVKWRDKGKKLKKLMVVAEYIYPKLKEELRAEGVAYLETNGNIFGKEGNLFLWVDNLKTERKEAGVTGRAFGKTGLKLLFQLLLEEGLLNMIYRVTVQGTGYASVHVDGFHEVYENSLPEWVGRLFWRFHLCRLPLRIGMPIPAIFRRLD
jgi:hypothetical protein